MLNENAQRRSNFCILSFQTDPISTKLPRGLLIDHSFIVRKIIVAVPLRSSLHPFFGIGEWRRDYSKLRFLGIRAAITMRDIQEDRSVGNDNMVKWEG
jgi:hypothetical protein